MSVNSYRVSVRSASLLCLLIATGCPTEYENFLRTRKRDVVFINNLRHLFTNLKQCMKELNPCIGRKTMLSFMHVIVDQIKVGMKVTALSIGGSVN